MNWSRSCLRRLFGMLSLGMVKRSRRGTWSPISCISPSTIHHSDFSSFFLSGREGDLFRRLGWPASVLTKRSREAPLWSEGMAESSRLATKSIAVFSSSWSSESRRRVKCSPIEENLFGSSIWRTEPVLYIPEPIFSDWFENTKRNYSFKDRRSISPQELSYN